LCIIDPQIHKRLAREDFHVSDYSPWEGWEIHGWPVMTLLRGKVIVEDGRLGKSVDYGRLVARHIDPVVLRRPSA
jgi:dihydropyrimidinase